MRILLTGASSFTGTWFANALAAAGHELVLPLLGAADSYTDGVRAQRVAALSNYGTVVGNCPFGSEQFLDLARSGGWDLLCHHAARVGDYRDPNFDLTATIAENTYQFPAVLAVMAKVRAVVITGSVFEQDEGAGNPPMRAFSAYGLSKGLSAQVMRFHCEAAGVNWGKFTIPNPFGPLEEPRFCAYLQRCFLKDETPEVRTPDYVRDNIHIDLLAARYAMFCTELAAVQHPMKLNPSGYVESQGGFAQRYARELSSRIGRSCAVKLGVQTDFAEPLMRINTDPAAIAVPGWNEGQAWDAIAEDIIARNRT